MGFSFFQWKNKKKKNQTRNILFAEQIRGWSVWNSLNHRSPRPGLTNINTIIKNCCCFPDFEKNICSWREKRKRYSGFRPLVLWEEGMLTEDDIVLNVNLKDLVNLKYRCIHEIWALKRWIHRNESGLPICSRVLCTKSVYVCTASCGKNNF